MGSDVLTRLGLFAALLVPSVTFYPLGVGDVLGVGVLVTLGGTPCEG